MASVEDRVFDLVAEQLGFDREKITVETNFVSDLGADSLDQVELIMELEREFDITIPDESAEKIQRVGERWGFLITSVAQIVSSGHPTVYDQDLAGHISGCRASQEQHTGGHIFGFSKSLCGNLLFHFTQNNIA